MRLAACSNGSMEQWMVCVGEDRDCRHCLSVCSQQVHCPVRLRGRWDRARLPARRLRKKKLEGFRPGLVWRSWIAGASSPKFECKMNANLQWFRQFSWIYILWYEGYNPYDCISFCDILFHDLICCSHLTEAKSNADCTSNNARVCPVWNGNTFAWIWLISGQTQCLW